MCTINLYSSTYSHCPCSLVLFVGTMSGSLSGDCVISNISPRLGVLELCPLDAKSTTMSSEVWNSHGSAPTLLDQMTRSHAMGRMPKILTQLPDPLSSSARTMAPICKQVPKKHVFTAAHQPHVLEDLVACFALESIIPYLTLAELLQLEASRLSIHGGLLGSRSWWEVARRELSTCVVISEGFQDVTLMKSLAAVIKKYVAEPCWPAPQCSPRQASDLVRTVKKFESEAAEHLHNGGQVGRVQVGCFHFRADSREDMPVVFSESLKMPITWKSVGHTSDCLGDCLETETLEMTMALHRDKLFLDTNLALDRIEDGQFEIGDDMTYEIPNVPQLLVDVHAISTLLTLEMHDVSVNSLTLNLHAGNGVCERTGGGHLLDALLAESLLCVMLVCDDTE